jgi:hypothetical protein
MVQGWSDPVNVVVNHVARWLRDEEATASVAVACPMTRSKPVCSGDSRTS